MSDFANQNPEAGAKNAAFIAVVGAVVVAVALGLGAFVPDLPVGIEQPGPAESVPDTKDAPPGGGVVDDTVKRMSGTKRSGPTDTYDPKNDPGGPPKKPAERKGDIVKQDSGTRTDTLEDHKKKREPDINPSKTKQNEDYDNNHPHIDPEPDIVLEKDVED